MLNGAEILNKVRQLPITQWNYIGAPGEQHIGPMAQDFYQLFGLGNSDKHISTLDPGGIAFKAIQQLADENDSLKKELKSTIEKQDAMNQLLLSKIEELQKKLQVTTN